MAIGSEMGVISLHDGRIKKDKFLELHHHSDEIIDLKFNKFENNLLLSGSEDFTAALFDIRKA